MTITLIISTYNWPKALDFCLQSVFLQTQLPDEIIIADDGSDIETKRIIEKFQLSSKVPLLHVWHPDNGFQLASIRNKSIAKAATDYIVQIDGDLILHPYFIHDHFTFARKNYFVSGSRLLLPQKFTSEILNDNNIPSTSRMLKVGSNQLNALRIPLFRTYLSTRYKTNQPYYVKGCNMAFWKSDLLKVNGYNEEITGWGKEDSELAIRLLNSNTKRLFLKFGGICYHLYHKENSRVRETLNDKILTETLVENRKWCDQGLSNHLDEAAIKKSHNPAT